MEKEANENFHSTTVPDKKSRMDFTLKVIHLLAKNTTQVLVAQYQT